MAALRQFRDWFYEQFMAVVTRAIPAIRRWMALVA